MMLPIDHPLAEKPALTIADLAAEPLILMHPYTSIYQLCMQLFEKAGVKPQILRTARLESTISSVEIGEAFSLFAESNFELFRHPNVTAVPLLDAPPLVIGAAYPLQMKASKSRKYLCTDAEIFFSFIQDPYNKHASGAFKHASGVTLTQHETDLWLIAGKNKNSW